MKYLVMHAAFITTISLNVLFSSALAQTNDNTPGGIHIPPGLSIKSIDSMEVPDLIKNISKKQLIEMTGRGYADAQEEEVVVLERYALEDNQKHIKTMAEVIPKLTMQPSELRGTKFDLGVFKGALTSGGHTDNGWTGITRLYQLPQLGLVKLDELDYISSGSGIVVAKEFINEDINGSIAIYLVKQSLSGKSISELTWFTENKMFILSVTGNINRDDNKYELIVELAEGIR